MENKLKMGEKRCDAQGFLPLSVCLRNNLPSTLKKDPKQWCYNLIFTLSKLNVNCCNFIWSSGMIPWIALGQDFGTSLKKLMSNRSTFVLSVIFTWCSGCSHLAAVQMFQNLEFPTSLSLQRHILVLCPYQDWTWDTAQGSCTLPKIPQEAEISLRTWTPTLKTSLKQTLQMHTNPRIPISENECRFPAVFS